MNKTPLRISLCVLIILSVLSIIVAIPVIPVLAISSPSYLIIALSALVPFLLASAVSYIVSVEPRRSMRCRCIMRFLVLNTISYSIIAIPVISLMAILFIDIGILLEPGTHIHANPLLALFAIISFLAIISLICATYLAPLISLRSSKDIRSSIKNSIRIYAEDPYTSSKTLVFSFILFAIPSILSVLPFVLVVSPVIIIPTSYGPMIIPISIFFLSFGMALGSYIANRYLVSKLGRISGLD